MQINSNNHIYEAAPPYLNNRELAHILRSQLITEIKESNPDLPDEEIIKQATERAVKENKMIWFGLQGISQPEADKLEQQNIAAYNDLAKDKSGEKVSELNLGLIRSKVKSINNLVIDGKEITDFDEFYKTAPKELVQWACNVVQSSIALSLAERKNFLPESDSPS